MPRKRNWLCGKIVYRTKHEALAVRKHLRQYDYAGTATGVYVCKECTKALEYNAWHIGHQYSNPFVKRRPNRLVHYKRRR